VEMVANHVNFI